MIYVHPDDPSRCYVQLLGNLMVLPKLAVAHKVSKGMLHACPKCDARFPFYRSPTPRIDSCEFESYSLECKECGTQLAGIIDPYDEELLLSELES